VRVFQIDSFTREVFSGNPAAICPLDEWVSDELMLAIANENNLSETAFFVKNKDLDSFDIRWFTPKREVDLCGHATLAAAYVVFHELGYESDSIIFNSRSGALSVVLNEDNSFTMDFPVKNFEKCLMPELITEVFGFEPKEAYVAGEDYLLLYDSEEIIKNVRPNFFLLQDLNCRGVCITAKGDAQELLAKNGGIHRADQEYDFVSRFFAPKYGIDEDPVTGSAHCMLLPFWANRLKSNILKARQLSKRGGEIYCELKNDRAFLSGYAQKYLEGFLYIS